MAMKPIETRYKGYRFRSRLEARWAVFFDHLQCSWEFEPEGFDLSDGTRYLPDFCVEGVYLEVKPFSGDLAQFSKASQLARDSGNPVICVAGNPSTTVYPVATSDEKWETVIITADDKYRPFFWNPAHGEIWENWRINNDDFLYDERLEKAIFAARSARFEFGESGADKKYSEDIL